MAYKEKKGVLIVEDEVSLLRALASQFNKNFKVLEAVDGLEGLDMALREHPDVILLDLVMPKMDGMTMLRKLRLDSWGKDAKVIILTNLHDETMVAEALAQGTFDYLVKADWNIGDVVKKVKEKLGRK